MVKGANQNISPSGPHFDLARPDDPDTTERDEGEETNQNIRNLVNDLKQKGLKNEK